MSDQSFNAGDIVIVNAYNTPRMTVVGYTQINADPIIKLSTIQNDKTNWVLCRFFDSLSGKFILDIFNINEIKKP